MPLPNLTEKAMVLADAFGFYLCRFQSASLTLSPMSRQARPGAVVQNRREGEDGGMSRFVPVEELFAGCHFDAEIVWHVRWYLSFKPSYRDLAA